MEIDNTIIEQNFPYINMTLQERNYYLNIIKSCKDINDSENKVDGISKCEIVELKLEKQHRIVVFNGSLSIGTDKKSENRCIKGEIYLNKKNIIVDMHITRLFNESENKIYTVFDEFKIEDGILKRRSQYNYNMENILDEIENEEMKGKLK